MQFWIICQVDKLSLNTTYYFQSTYFLLILKLGPSIYQSFLFDFIAHIYFANKTFGRYHIWVIASYLNTYYNNYWFTSNTCFHDRYWIFTNLTREAAHLVCVMYSKMIYLNFVFTNIRLFISWLGTVFSKKRNSTWSPNLFDDLNWLIIMLLVCLSKVVYNQLK